MQKTDWLIAVCGFALFILLSSWAILRVPMNMDEALAYHVLACSDHPASFWNTFTLACGEHYNLTTPFGFTYSRAYDYVGGLDSFLYTPFYRLYPSPYVQYVFGLFYYILFALCLSRLISKPWLGFFVFLCFFPALFQFIHDTGPIKFTALVFALTPLVYRQAIKEKPVPQVAAGLLMGILFALATEEKVLFVHLLLPLFLFTLGAD